MEGTEFVDDSKCAARAGATHCVHTSRALELTSFYGEAVPHIGVGAYMGNLYVDRSCMHRSKFYAVARARRSIRCRGLLIH